MVWFAAIASFNEQGVTKWEPVESRKWKAPPNLQSPEPQYLPVLSTAPNGFPVDQDCQVSWLEKKILILVNYQVWLVWIGDVLGPLSDVWSWPWKLVSHFGKKLWDPVEPLGSKSLVPWPTSLQDGSTKSADSHLRSPRLFESFKEPVWSVRSDEQKKMASATAISRASGRMSGMVIHLFAAGYPS